MMEKLVRKMEKLTAVTLTHEQVVRFKGSFDRMKKRIEALEQTEQVVLAKKGPAIGAPQFGLKEGYGDEIADRALLPILPFNTYPNFTMASLAAPADPSPLLGSHIVNQINSQEELAVQMEIACGNYSRAADLLKLATEPVPDHRLPLFLIIGVQKAGTTFYRGLLHLHPYLQGAWGLSLKRPVSEAHFFGHTSELINQVVSSADGNHTHRRFTFRKELNVILAEYAKHFRPITRSILREAVSTDILPFKYLAKSTESFTFDCTPSYLDDYHTHRRHQIKVPIAARVKAILRGSVHIAIVLRDPVERYHSYNRMARKYREVNEWLSVDNQSAFEKTLRECRTPVACPDSNIQRGFYARYIQQWGELHSKAGKIHIVFNEDLYRNPGKELNATTDWLGLTRYSVTAERSCEISK
jgi:hypothetical protein